MGVVVLGFVHWVCPLFTKGGYPTNGDTAGSTPSSRDDNPLTRNGQFAPDSNNSGVPMLMNHVSNGRIQAEPSPLAFV